MKYIPRVLTQKIQQALNRGKSVLLLGARQTGKTTLIQQFSVNFKLSFIQPVIRQRYEQIPGLLTGELEVLAENNPDKILVWIDEVQKVPAIFDVIQDLIDREIAQFILTGSSARKLRASHSTNWLPGRLVVLRLDPFIQTELNNSNLTIPLEDLLLYGTLPGIVMLDHTIDKETDLASYVNTYLEEEIRAEALVRKIGHFSRFLALAASESGQIVNFRKLSQEIGVAHTTIADYYQILEDCLVAARIEPFHNSKTRRRLMKAPKYLLFDLGIRRISAREGRQLPAYYWGHLFEQWVGLELIRYLHSTPIIGRLYFWRDSKGPEVDWVLEHHGILTPIEVKWTDQPRYSDAKHLVLFKKENPNINHAWLVCRTPRKVKLAEGIYACPWQELSSILQ